MVVKSKKLHSLWTCAVKKLKLTFSRGTERMPVHLDRRIPTRSRFYLSANYKEKRNLSAIAQAVQNDINRTIGEYIQLRDYYSFLNFNWCLFEFLDSPDLHSVFFRRPRHNLGTRLIMFCRQCRIYREAKGQLPQSNNEP
jgi:hypothetical protein